MTFETAELPTDLSAALREIEQRKGQLSADAKAVLIAAATRLDDFNRVVAETALELDEAAELRVGAMDSESRAMDISRQVRAAITNSAQRLLSLYEKSK